MHVGIADHYSWAVAVTASSDFAVADRRRMDLVEAGVAAAPIEHESQGLDLPAAVALVAQVRAAATRASAVALDDLAAALAGPVQTISLRAWPPDFPADVETQRRAPYNSRADSVMYRQVLAELADERGWTVHLYDAKAVERQAATLLGGRADEVLHGPRTTLGPPWAKDHRIALAAAILAAST